MKQNGGHNSEAKVMFCTTSQLALHYVCITYITQPPLTKRNRCFHTDFTLLSPALYLTNSHENSDFSTLKIVNSIWMSRASQQKITSCNGRDGSLQSPDFKGKLNLSDMQKFCWVVLYILMYLYVRKSFNLPREH